MHWQDTETRQLGHTLSPGSHPLRACCIPHCNVSHLDLAVQRTDMCAARTLLQRSRGPRGCMLHASRLMQALLFATNANQSHMQGPLPATSAGVSLPSQLSLRPTPCLLQAAFVIPPHVSAIVAVREERDFFCSALDHKRFGLEKHLYPYPVGSG